jgi:hypothetical protein
MSESPYTGNNQKSNSPMDPPPGYRGSPPSDDRISTHIGIKDSITGYNNVKPRYNWSGDLGYWYMNLPENSKKDFENIPENLRESIMQKIVDDIKEKYPHSDQHNKRYEMLPNINVKSYGYNSSPHSPPVYGTPHGHKDSPERVSNTSSDFETMVEFYLADNPQWIKKGRISELEIRFGTNPKSGHPVSKIDYDNVVKQFYNAGFSTDNPDGLSILRIHSEEINRNSGEIRMSNIRAEIMGIDLIREYCRTNNLQKLIDLPSTSSAVADKIKFTRKMPPFIGDNRETNKPLKPLDFPDHNFRVSYQYENDFTVRSDTAKRIISKWIDTKKTFRYINRVRLNHPEYPVFLDISIVKSSAKANSRVPIPQYTVQESRVFTSQETYEIELEIDNNRVGPGTSYVTTDQLMTAIRKCTRIVLSGLQGTSYPIPYSEQERVLKQYIICTFDDSGKQYTDQLFNHDFKVKNIAKRKLTRHFIGPSSFTLQLNNIAAVPEGEEKTLNVPNIRTNYTVTDKADGDRKLLYISHNGNLYMIDTNMKVLFTGIHVQDKDLFNTVIDGEHIKYDKNEKFVNIYAAFDIYFINGKSVRELNFAPMLDTDVSSNFRLPLLNNLIKKMKPVSILDKDSGNSNPNKTHASNDGISKHACWMTIKCKEFYSSRDDSIFKNCSTILSKVNDGSYEYNTDGLIFTPASTGVGGEQSGQAGPLHKFTWPMSFKWKPPKYNTVDFLVSIKKDKTGKDEIFNVFQDGVNMATMQNIIKYKTLVLRCGFNRMVHGYMNPMVDVINDQLPSPGDSDNERKYEPVPFQPTNPYDPNASLCNVQLTDNGTGGMVLLTKENEYFEEDMIVEFSYDRTNKGNWRWIPLRVRYDKTNDLRSGSSNYGNAYHVANSNWRSIHNPITDEMITTGENIPTYSGDEDVYYNRSGKDTNTKSLRNFHNLYVKRKLIVGVSNRENTLIDYAVGKAGDLPKWVTSKLKFVFGMDVSPDNIENQLDGACARYLNFKRKYTKMPDALFAVGDSKLNIRDGKAGRSERDKQITKAIFGQGSKDKNELGAGIYKWYGIGENGFDISSVQFALHYFFESERIMHTFIRNIAECTKLNGYFIGTCYDGKTVFDMLQNKYKGESVTIMRNDEKIFEITKQYDYTGFTEDEYSIGYPIDVYQESINKEFREYLVNFKYLQRVMENYGFTLITKEEASSIGLPNGSGLFDELFKSMEIELEKNSNFRNDYEAAPNMSNEEKRISFMNRYFIFRKTHNVDAEKVSKLMMRPKGDEDVDEMIDRVNNDDEKLNNAIVDHNPIIRKLTGKKIKIVIGRNANSNVDNNNTGLKLIEPAFKGNTVIIKRKKKT